MLETCSRLGCAALATASSVELAVTPTGMISGVPAAVGGATEPSDTSVLDGSSGNVAADPENRRYHLQINMVVTT